MKTLLIMLLVVVFIVGCSNYDDDAERIRSSAHFGGMTVNASLPNSFIVDGMNCSIVLVDSEVNVTENREPTFEERRKGIIPLSSVDAIYRYEMDCIFPENNSIENYEVKDE